MTIFVLIAAALVAIAAAAVIVPLAAHAKSGAPPAHWAAIAVIVVLGGGGASVYAALGNRAWSDARAGDSPQAMVGRLARQLEENPNDLAGWLLLGRSYGTLEEFPLAARAYQHADELAGHRNVDALSGLAEALVLDDETQLTRRGGQLFEQALTIDPKAGKALFYGAAAAERRGELRLARDRFQTLLEESPPAEVRPILERQIAALDQRLSGVPQATQARVRVRVTLDPRIAAKAPPNAPCFVFVRTPGVPGPPLAVRRVGQNFPQVVELGSADAMIAGHGIELNQDVEVVARISASGTPTAHAGDLFGSVQVRVGQSTEANVEINQLSP